MTGDISGQITTSLNKSIRGISAFGNIDINGNVELVINGGPSSVIGVGAWNGKSRSRSWYNDGREKASS